ncbi:MAG: DUF4290 domain-containing protein [Bacteroidales bacterium]|jgi:hypothetical protein|nr:DUF4290 domain-containing protein [Bacteroidales bacterium]
MLEYNTARNQLIIKTYGRNIQKMIENAVKIEDVHKRNEAAKAVIRIMAQVNPETSHSNAQRESEDYWHKLWDHLIIISDYKLDIDTPFPKLVPHAAKPKQIRHNYDKRAIRYRTYGRNMENIIKTVSQYPEAQQQRLLEVLANHLKKLFLCYNRDSVEDAFIIAQLREISGGKLQLPETYKLESTKEILKNHNNMPSASMLSQKNNGRTKPKKRKKIKRPQF